MTITDKKFSPVELTQMAYNAIGVLKKKPKFEDLETEVITVIGVEINDNFTTVILSVNKSYTLKSQVYIGHSKCNPNCDQVSEERGITIACSRALSRIIDTNYLALGYEDLD